VPKVSTQRPLERPLERPIERPLLSRFEIEKEPNPNGSTPNPAAKEEPANPQQQANRCKICGKFISSRRTICSTHSSAEIMPFLEKAAGGEER
jgi:hypothetical protein